MGKEGFLIEIETLSCTEEELYQLRERPCGYIQPLPRLTSPAYTRR